MFLVNLVEDQNPGNSTRRIEKSARMHRGKRFVGCCCWILLVSLSFLVQVSSFSNRGNGHIPNNNKHLLYEKKNHRKAFSEAPSPEGHVPQKRRQHRARSRKTQLRWIAQSFEKMQLQGKSVPTGVVECIDNLASAQSQDEVIRIGNQLSHRISGEQISPAVAERLIKATATAGLFQLSLNLTTTLLADEILPSEMTQDALCSSLRRAGRSNQIVKLVVEMGQVARKRSLSVSSSSFNIMLAALCDNQAASKRRKSTNEDPAGALQTAWSWIAEDKSQRELGVHATSVSYATILQAAARAGNRTLADEVWATMTEREIQPNAFSYNAMLKLAGKGQLTRDDETLQLWQEMKQDSSIQPDCYTIDLLLPALARGGLDNSLEIKEILNNFVAKNSESVVSNAFEAFLVTLNNAGQMRLARGLFEAYVKPFYAPVLMGHTGSLRVVTPTCRHFNIILEGYGREAKERFLSPNTDDNEATGDLKVAAWELYNTLLNCRGIEPDEYTFSTMMGLAPSPDDICHLLNGALRRFKTLSPVLQRSAMTAFGALGDASSACWLFAAYTLPSLTPQIREWNVLLGALSRVSDSNTTTVINILQSPAAALFGESQTDVHKSPLIREVNGVSPPQAMANILQLLVCGSDEVRVPKPDSQSFCLAAAALQSSETRALVLFRQAMDMGVGADGRFVNAVLRSFGEDIESALAAWKEEIRPACLNFENRNRKFPPSPNRPRGKNLVAAYDGLLNVAGRALRPDIGLRLVYAMKREGLEPNETSLNSYRSGKRQGQAQLVENRAKAFARKLVLDPYESLLFVECTKYDRKDRRRDGERRVRIIV